MFELALLLACVGLPTAQADPDDDCCGVNNSSKCAGCIGGYYVDHGLLFGCQSTGGTQGCSTWELECQFVPGPVSKFNGDCTGAPIALNQGGVSIIMNGCAASHCD